MEEDNNTIDNDMMASMNDGIEVIIPKKMQELIERIKEKKGLHRQKIIHKRAELKRCENQKKSDGIKKDLLDLENGEKVLLRNIGEKYRGAEIQEENLSLEVDALAQLDEYKSRLIHYKNQEFNDAIITELRKFNKMRGFKYYVLFLEFQSYNITEMAEYSLMKKLVKDNFKADNILDHLFVDVSGDMDIGHLIEEIDYALGKELKPIKDKGFSGELNEELAVWIILYFHCPFYLSELALELLIKFLNEVYSIPGFCFAFIFKKIEDATIIPNSCDTYVRFFPYEKDTYMFYNYIRDTLVSEESKLQSRLMSPRLVRELVSDYEQYRMSINTTSYNISCIYKVHRSIYSPRTLADNKMNEFIRKKIIFTKSLEMLSCILDIHEEHSDKRYKDIVLMYCDFLGEHFFTPIIPNDVLYQSKSKKPSQVNTWKERLKISNVIDDKTTYEGVIKVSMRFISMLNDELRFSRSFQFEKKVMLEFSDRAKEVLDRAVENKSRMNIEVDKEKIDEGGKKDSLHHLMNVKGKNNRSVKDHDDRKKMLMVVNTKGEDKEKAKRDIDTIEQLSKDLHLIFKDFFSETIEKFIEYLKLEMSHLLIDEYEEIMRYIHPDIMGNYMTELGQKQKGTKNPSEASIRILYEIVSQSPDKFKSSDLFFSFKSSLLSSYPKTKPSTVPHLFYYSLTTLKRVGLINESNKMKQLLQKIFFKRSTYNNDNTSI